MLTPSSKPTGFTIVELLIVIVVIAVLAAISTAAYTGIQDRARNAKMSSDIANINKAILSARANTGDILMDITGSTATPSGCMNEPPGTDLAALNHVTSDCWTYYTSTLQLISDASGIDITGMVDPWGRPYAIDENEGAGSPCGNGQDFIAVYARPHATWAYLPSPIVTIPYMTPGC